MNERARVGVLISGRGSNLQALIDASAAPDYPAEIVCVISNVAAVEGLNRARRAGIPVHVVGHQAYGSRESFDDAVNALLCDSRVAIICLAGFMRILSDRFVEAWRGRLINIHPSLLPAFKGLDVHNRVLQSGARISGCTVHFVVCELDSGPIIAQAAVPVLPGDGPDALAARTLAAEHRLYPLALRLLAEGRVSLAADRVVYERVQSAAGELICPGSGETGGLCEV
jgi:phosphoribosylglycinamide formyltransferase-1